LKSLRIGIMTIKLDRWGTCPESDFEPFVF